MKATLDIPDALYRRVKSKSALAGHPVREVAIRLFSEWVERPIEDAPATKKAPAKLPPWFGVVKRYAANVDRHDMAAVRESIAQARSRT